LLNRKNPLKPQQDVIASYNEHFANEGCLKDSDAFYLWVLKKLSPFPNSLLLDVACGEGHLLRFALKQGLQAQGIDFSIQGLRTAKRIARTNNLLLADGEQLPYLDGIFDYATNLGSLEHFPSPERGLREMRRVLKANGKAALVLPNSYYWLDIIWHVWRRGFPVSHSQSIERFATLGEWKELIEQNGFKVTQVYKYNLCFPRTLEDWRWYKRFPQKMIYFLLSPITPRNLSYSFLFICQRHEES
jgi:SAM-dependent methyltransferase